MRKVSRRAFSGAMLSASVLAAQEGGGAPNPPALDLPPWTGSQTEGDRFEFPGPPSPRTKWTVPLSPRKYFPEWLPALFQRTVEIDSWTAEKSRLRWIFTGPSGGFTIEAGGGQARLAVRYYDSPGLAKVPPVEARPGRHPEGLWEETSVAYSGELRAITVVADHRLTVRVLLNGKEALSSHAALDVSRHQLAFSGDGAVRGKLLPPAVEAATVEVDDAVRFQKMLGWGGTTPPPAFAELSQQGVREWWRILAEYNLLLHREYPTGALLNREMTNWDTPQDASPHYYGDNFPNCETSDFGYMRRVRQLGGKVIFEFWELPPWARVRDASGKLTDAPLIEPYVNAMVRYCQVSRDKTGHAPEIVGIQNEVTQSAENWQQMALALRRGLDAAGFAATRIHMHNAPFSVGGVKAANAFRQDPAVWKTIDYAASNLYDYQEYFHDPDGFDARLAALREATGGKPFFAVELCVNNGAFQTRAYRVALAMGQLYHKVLTQLDACGVMYCWTLLNVVQPSYGWTRTLLVPDPEHGMMPVASSHQLRVFGAYSRRVREGMERVKAASSNPDVLASAFRGASGESTLILLNRSTAPQKVQLKWRGAEFRYLETSSPREENSVAPAGSEVLVAPGAIVTLTNVELGSAAISALDPQRQPFVCTDYTQGKVFLVNAAGRVEWSYDAPNANDVWALPNGNLLFNTGHGVREVTRDKRVVFSYESSSEVYACQRLPDGNTFIGECNAGRLLEVNPAGKIVKQIRLLPEGADGGHTYMRNARRLENGHYLVCHYGGQVVKEYDAGGNIVREIPAPGGPHSVVRLPDGNTLISTADMEGAVPAVFEITPGGETVWSVRGDELPGISLKFMAGLQRLPNGNTVMCNWLGHGNFGKAPHIIEVTRDKKVVWTFADHQTMRTVSSVQILGLEGPVLH